MNIKMSDVFGAGFSLWNESGFINDGESDLGSMSCNSFTDAAVIAINSYDANQSLIAKQAEQIKMLRSQLELSTESLYAVWEKSDLGTPTSCFSQADSNKETLEATKERA